MADEVDELRERIGARVDATLQAHPEWPCRRGCDRCCRNLGRVLQLTGSEWVRLRGAVDALPDATRGDVERRVLELDPSRAPIVCPLLDRESGACLVYAERPLGCRSFGFYAARDGGRYCDEIHQQFGDAPVLWGSHEGLERLAERRLGPARSLLDWWGSEAP